MFLHISALLAGLVALVWAADRFVVGASGVAAHFKVPPLVIGLVILGFGTSAPELLISGFAAISDNANLGIGNALGSNIANISLVLGATALVSPIDVKSGVLRREFPILLGASMLVWGMLADGSSSRHNGIFSLTLLMVILAWMLRTGHRASGTDSFTAEVRQDLPSIGIAAASSWLVVGLAVLMGSAKAMVWAAIEIARTIGVDDLVIGLTVVAIGTSLPELATCVASALKGEHDMAVGNIIGSNLFNILAVIGIPAIIRPGVVATDALDRDFPTMMAASVLLFVVAFGVPGNKAKKQVSRPEGALLLVCYFVYMAVVYHQSVT